VGKANGRTYHAAPGIAALENPLGHSVSVQAPSGLLKQYLAIGTAEMR